MLVLYVKKEGCSVLKISEFSRLTKVPAKTLRFYDDIGLLKPASVDRFTGYRYYSAAQLPRLNRILALKGLGLSLEQIKDVLDEDLSAEQIRGMLRLKLAEIQQNLIQEQQRLAYVEAMLSQIEQENKMSEYDVIIKSVAPFKAAGIRVVAPRWDQLSVTLNHAFDELADYIRSHGAALSPNPEECGITLYHDEEWRETDIQLEAVFGITGDLAPSSRVQVYTMPSVEMMASTVHHGSFASLGSAYNALTNWIEQNGYEISGPSREINLVYERHGDPNKYVTEIQFPVRKRA